MQLVVYTFCLMKGRSDVRTQKVLHKRWQDMFSKNCKWQTHHHYPKRKGTFSWTPQ